MKTHAKKMSVLYLRPDLLTRRSLSFLVAMAMSGSTLLLSGCHNPSIRAAGVPWRIDPVLRVGSDQSSAQRSESLYRLGRYYDGQNRFEFADESYRKALDADPENVEAINALGVLLARQGRFSEGIALLETAVAQSPGRTHILSNLGYACLLAGRNNDAAAHLSKAVQMDPANTRASSNLALAMRHGGRIDEGLAAGESSVPDVKAVDPVTRVAATVAEAVPPVAGSQQAADTAGKPHFVTLERSGMDVVEVAPQVLELRSAGFEQVPHGLSGESAQATAVAPSSAVRSYRLEIANGMGMTGAARRLRNWLRQDGVPTAALRDQRPFRQARTEVQFVQGFQADASLLAERLGASVVRLSGPLPHAVQVRVVLGKDLRPMLASLPAGGQSASRTQIRALIAGADRGLETVLDGRVAMQCSWQESFRLC